MSRIRWIVIYTFHDINSCAFLANHHSRKHCHTVCKQFILVMIGTDVYFLRAIILERLVTQFASDMSIRWLKVFNRLTNPPLWTVKLCKISGSGSGWHFRTFRTLFHSTKVETNHLIIRVGNPDEWCTQNCLPQDCLPVGISEVGNPEGNR